MIGLTWRAGVVVGLVLAGSAQAGAQETGPATVLCPEVLGVGVIEGVPFCNVLIQRDPALGIQVRMPPHRGAATLTFRLHNRHVYSAEEARDGSAYAEYLATIAIATSAGEILSRGAVLSEFRTERDLVDRVPAEGGISGLKAIAPTGSEVISVAVPADVDRLVIVGQSQVVTRRDGQETITALGRPVAVLSGATVSYQPR